MISIPPIGSAMSLGHERNPNRQAFGDQLRKQAQFSNTMLGAGIAQRARVEVERAKAAGQRSSNTTDIGNISLTAVAHAIVMLRETGVTAEIDYVNHKLVLSW